MGRWAEGEKGANQALWGSLQEANRRVAAKVRAQLTPPTSPARACSRLSNFHDICSRLSRPGCPDK